MLEPILLFLSLRNIDPSARQVERLAATVEDDLHSIADPTTGVFLRQNLGIVV